MSESPSSASENQPKKSDSSEKQEGLIVQSETIRLPRRQDIGDLLFPALNAKLKAGDPNAIEQIIAYQKELRLSEIKLQENAQRLQERKLDQQEKELDQKHELAIRSLDLEIQKEENRVKDRRSEMDLEIQKEKNRINDERSDREGRQKNIFLGLVIFALLFTASLGFSYGIKDKEARVPITLLTTGAALLGGTALKATTSGKNQSPPKNQQTP